MSDLGRQLLGYRLTTAEITYRLPDHPALLQQYIWQDLDLPPRFPTLRKFLRFWEANLEGRLFAVRIAATGIVGAASTWLASELRLH